MTDVLRDVVEAWNRGRINYAGANGFENYPHKIGRDVDVVVDRRHLESASTTIRSVLEQRGWRVVVRNYPELIQHFGIGPPGTALLIIDVFPGLRWGPVWLVEQPQPSCEINGIRTDPWATFVKRVLLHVLVGPTQKFASDSSHLRLSKAEAGAAAARLPPLFGAPAAARLLSAIEREDVVQLEALRPQLRKALIRSSVAAAPLRALRTTVQWAATRVVFATTRPMMPALTIASSDGIDRSSVIDEVTRQAQEQLRCPVVAVRHGRPGILPRLPSEGGMRSGAVRMSRAADLMSALRALYFTLDFVLGRLLLDRRIGVDLGLVLYDGGALDMRINPAKYGLTPGRLVRLMPAVLARSSVTVFLCEEPAERNERDWTVDENDQFQMAVAINEGPRVAAERIVDRLLEVFSERNGRRYLPRDPAAL